MHQIYTTPGFIIDSRPFGEAGKLLSIFTHDLGLIMATAQGIRLEKSKLRYHSQDYSFGEFSFVRGKEFWRLTNAQFNDSVPAYVSAPVDDSSAASENILPQRSEATHAGELFSLRGRELVLRISLLLRRLLHGEESNPELFDCVLQCHRFISQTDTVDDEQSQTLESITVLRILHRLGYIGKDLKLGELLTNNEITTELLDSYSAKRTIINHHINKALKESHL